jgi:methionine-rich copper-binding protein CopC
MQSSRRGTDRTCTKMFSHSSRPTPRTKHRRFLRVEPLEQRVVLSTYWVSPSGNDSNSGSSTSPYATLQHAMMSLQPGDTLDVKSGSYTGFIVGWDTQPASSGDPYGTINGTAGNPITIQADPSAAAGSVVINNKDNKTQFGIDLEPGCNYVTISGITVDGSSGNIAGYPNHGGGIKVCGNNSVVQNCTVTNIGYGFGIITDQANNVLLKGNTISNIHGQGNANYGHGIYIADNTVGAVLDGNIIHNCDYIGIHVNGDLGDSGGPPGLVQNATIKNNVIYDNGQNGINADGLQSSTIENNLIYNYANYGICLYQIDAGAGSKNNIIVNNTIYSGTSTGTGGSIRILDASTGNTILNNILLDGSNIVYRISADSQSGTVSNYNIVPNGAQIQSEDTGQNESFSQWQSSTGQDHNSFSATAAQLFVNPSANNYQELSTSPSIGAGTSTDAPSTDILGNPRPSSKGYDIGCYEYETTTSAAPTIASESPAAGATNVAVSTAPTATFNEAVQAGTISFTLKSSSGTVAGSASYNSTTNVTTFTPTPTSALAYNTTYTATISGAQSASGVSMTAPFSWSFTTDAAPPAVTSETPASGATGVAVSTTATATFNAAVQAGTISFTLKNSSGTVAAAVTYNSSNNTATLTPSAALANSTTYTATVSGATDSAGDPMTSAASWSFATAAAVAPAVTSETPASGATSVAMSMAPTATFNQAMQAGTISFALKNSSGSSVAGSVSYNSTTYVTTFTPTPASALASNTTYTATISGAQSMSGVSMTAPFSWSFTTAAASSTTSIWSSTAKPANPSEADSSAAELGVKFYSDVSGSITGLRFYKGGTNTGTHVADLWTSSGKLLATATFKSETSSGWQQVNFATPVAITAGTTYVASYHTNVGHYADDQNYFASQYNSGSLHVPADGGVYAYGAAGSFPTQVWNASNYWVDVVLSPSGSPSIATTATANQSVSVLTAVAPSSGSSSQLVNGAGAIQPNGLAIPGQGSASATAKLQGKSLSAQWVPAVVGRLNPAAQSALVKPINRRFMTLGGSELS